MRLSFSFLLLIFLFKISVCFSQPKGIHLSWNGINEVKTSTTIAITWLNDKADKGIVQFGINNKNLDKKINSTEIFSEDLKCYVNKITLENLTPATYYFYKVGSDKNGWSNVYKFRTAPPVGNRSKIVVGLWSDTQNNGGNYNFEVTDSIVKQMSKDDYYFTIHNGDIVENGSVIKSWKNYFNVAQPINANYPLMSVTGNHDVVNDTNSSIFQKPFPIFYQLMNLPNDQLNYSYDYGNTHFVAINSGYAQGAEKVGKVLFQQNSNEYKWLDADLSKARQNKNITWIILYCHYPLYSFGASHIVTWQDHLKPLVDKYKVDLCIAGHRHVYERHKAVRGSQIFEESDTHVYNQPKGTVYVTNGSCGGSLQGVGGWDLPTMVYTPKEKVYTYAVMTIENKIINYKVFDKDGNQVDYFKITKN